MNLDTEMDWEYNVLGVYNYSKPGQLTHYYDYIIENHEHIEGDIIEAGVYKGRSLLATALLLKKLNSPKKVFGFDSFKGFPEYDHENDKIQKFDDLYKDGSISKDHLEKVRKNVELRSFVLREPPTSRSISLSGDFSDVNQELILEKAKLLGLDNIELIEGPFENTMSKGTNCPKKIMAALIDCDLYMSYATALPFVWSKLSLGGYIWLDEYYSLKFPGARIATDEFFADKADKPQKHREIPGEFERWYVRKIFQAK